MFPITTATTSGAFDSPYLVILQCTSIFLDLPNDAQNRAIAQAWAAVLDPGIADTLQTTSDFFEMGGHSLLLAKLVSAIAEETGVTVTIPEVLENPTLGGMARIVEDSDTKLRDPVPTVFAGLRNERALSNSNTLGREDAKMSVVLQHAVGDLTASTGDFSTSAASSSEFCVLSVVFGQCVGIMTVLTLEMFCV